MSLNDDMKRWVGMAQNETNESRFRSFCERYMIERASTFRAAHEEEDQWTCMLNAKSAYRKIEAMGRGISAEDEALRATNVAPNNQQQRILPAPPPQWPAKWTGG